MGGHCVRHIDQQGTRATEIIVEGVQILPVCGHPIIGGRAGKDRACLETNHRFAASPSWGVEGVTSSNEWVLPIAGDATHAPYGAASRIRSPRCYTGWIVYRHADEPAMIKAAIRPASISNIQNV